MLNSMMQLPWKHNVSVWHSLGGRDVLLCYRLVTHQGPWVHDFAYSSYLPSSWLSLLELIKTTSQILESVIKNRKSSQINKHEEIIQSVKNWGKLQFRNLWKVSKFHFCVPIEQISFIICDEGTHVMLGQFLSVPSSQVLLQLVGHSF